MRNGINEPITIYNNLGQVILLGEIKDSIISIDVSSLDTGLYWMKSENGSQSFMVQ